LKYRLVYTQRAFKDLKNLDPQVRQRIGQSLKRLENDPLKFARKLTDPRIGSYRFRIGEYRVVFDVEGEEIVVLRVGHRRDIYRR
jgi:mRNA interferase RelE/StbE